jgi:hypothetical protein
MVISKITWIVSSPLWTDGDFCHQGQDTEFAQNKIVEKYWHDHSSESSWEAISDGTISFSIQSFLGENAFSEFF